MVYLELEDKGMVEGLRKGGRKKKPTNKEGLKRKNDSENLGDKMSSYLEFTKFALNAIHPLMSSTNQRI